MNTLFELSEKLKKREISSLELTKAYIGRIEEKNPLLNAVVHKTYDKALALAERADKRLAEGNAP
ncbi:MAG: Asp-tRNA(Asn)/Glu-tRNA(Gln) amidotransferase subunit GatA, partial [Lachnospiraceae bacterium]|nr:Asp-tRNA(Asn)/Glu-tRNA(Gln) amidotransferase subunit GatA [Lachnospiraceae bacterium]